MGGEKGGGNNTVKEENFAGHKIVRIVQLVPKRKIKNCTWKLDCTCALSFAP